MLYRQQIYFFQEHVAIQSIYISTAIQQFRINPLIQIVVTN